jgi:ribosomal protein S14
MNYEDYIGFNSDATIAYGKKLSYFPSQHWCNYCEYTVKALPYYFLVPNNDYNGKKQKYVVINQLFCPFNRVKIDGVIYNRDRNVRVDNFDLHTSYKNRSKKKTVTEYLEYINQMFDKNAELKRMRDGDAAYKEYLNFDLRCHRCGVPHGFIHHIGCGNEECPKCADPFDICKCSEREYIVKNDMNDYGIAVGGVGA